MALPKSRVESSLKAKGFDQIDSHHKRFVYVTADGKRTSISTKTSHTPKMKDIPDNILSQMALQLRLTKQEFVRLITCTLSRADYEEILRRLQLI